MNRSIPTPSISEVSIGPFTVHFYALCIIAGIAVAIWLGNKRLAARDESLRGVVSEVAVIAVPSGIIGGRLYHVITTPEDFFGSEGDPVAILKIWQGGLGIWGAISLGAVGAFYSYRKLARSMNLPSFGYSSMQLLQEFSLHKRLDGLEIGLTPNYLDALLIPGGVYRFHINIDQVAMGLSKPFTQHFFMKRSGAPLSRFY